MYLKTLTIRGFKSFASATTFEFEPGVTAVVGPNGSGKSNVVDALAWVMGEQGAKTLRGGKMEDVIFAGTSGRAPLGRAQVSLTIDNSDGALPIEYSEVTISRTLFRSGGSEYAINNAPARLLDIQELLSDSGLGREMHVIVGQGQLDRVLHATPEERRGFIEEAAGILKHRRRKEKTLRKLDATQANLDRLEDLTKELARQLKPLGRQAQTARRARTVQSALRDAKARLLADDLVAVLDHAEAARRQQSELESALKQAQEVQEAASVEVAKGEAEAARLAPAAAQARTTWYELSRLEERFKSLGSLAQERQRLLGAAEPEPLRGEDPEALEARAAAAGHEAAEADAATQEARAALEAAGQARAAAEDEQRLEDARLTQLLRAVADRREGLARLAGQVGAARAKVEAAEGEAQRSAQARDESGARGDAATAALVQAQAEAETLAAQAVEPAQRAAAAREATQAARAAAVAARDAVSPLTEARAAWAAKVAVLGEESAEPKDASLYLDEHRSALLGVLADALTVEPGYEAAVQAALRGAGAALVANDRDVLLAIAAADTRSPGASLELLAAAPAPGPTGTSAPAGTRFVSEVVRADEHASAVVTALLGSVVLAPTDEDAARAASEGWITVTKEGHRWDGPRLVLGSGAGSSALGRRAALAQALQELQAAQLAEEQAKLALLEASPLEDAARAEEERALTSARAAADAVRAAEAEVRRLNAVHQQASAEGARAQAAQAAARKNADEALVALEALAVRLEAAQAVPEEQEPSTADRDRLAAAATAARAAEVEARLALRAAEESAKRLHERTRALTRAAATEREARAAAARRAAVRAARAAKAEWVAALVERVRQVLRSRIDVAEAAVAAAEEAERRRTVALDAARARLNRAGEETQRLTQQAHEAQLGQAQREAKRETLSERSLQELGLTPERLVEDFGPHLPVPFDDDETPDKWASLRQEVDDDGRATGGAPFVREEQEKRLKRAEKDLAALGKVNPLALEEFAALEERHEYLTGQLADLRSSRQDLLSLVKEVDDHVREVFASAYEDTAREFVKIFAKLFPGGEGKLRLTEPDDLLTTGIEVEARPAGKKVKRLSLLSGGERSLTAIALLVAIFTARPSPFYVMDEVEAALDERNLMRLLGVFSDLREHSQLIIITHQKHTMDIADALYGVSMRGDGVTRVISQRIDHSA